MRIVHAAEVGQLAKPMIHRRSRGAGFSQKVATPSVESTGPDRPLHLHDKQVIVIIESEGAVFDINRYWHETAYLPSFIGCFGSNVDPSIVGEIWRTVALETSLRGEHPLVILLAALRVLNVLFPSMQRAVIIKTLEKYSLSEKTFDDLKLDEKHLSNDDNDGSRWRRPHSGAGGCLISALPKDFCEAHSTLPPLGSPRL